MELGEKIRVARLAAGLSQRQLCGQTITRNMLSQIEHGTARPSIDTLRILAARLDLPVSYFLEETVLTSPNRVVMDRARAAFDSQDLSGAVRALEDYRGPDPVYDRERQLLEYLLRLELAQNALDQGKEILARELLTHMPHPPMPEMRWTAADGCCSPGSRERIRQRCAKISPVWTMSCCFVPGQPGSPPGA